MKKTLSLLLILILLAVSATAFAQGNANYAARLARPNREIGFVFPDVQLPELDFSAPNVSASPEQLTAQSNAQPDIGLYLLISLVPIAAFVVGVLWVIRFKEKHIDGK